MRSAIFRKLLFSSFLLIAATLVVLDFCLTRYTSQHETESLEATLAGKARILAQEIPAPPETRLEAWAQDAERRSAARVTLIDAKGVVLADSEHDSQTMENHAGRPEVRQALAGQVGSSVRHSATLDRDFCYVAIPLNSAGRAGQVLRLAAPQAELGRAISAVRRQLLLASVTAAAVALLLALWFARTFTGRVRSLQTFAERMLDAEGPRRLLPESNDELGLLAGSLSRLSVRLHGLVERLSTESQQRQSILASMVEGVLAVDDKLRITFCNDAFLQAAGASTVPEQTPVREVLRDPVLVDMLRGVAGTGAAQKGRLEITAPRHRVYEVQAASLASPNSRGALAILHDITDLERLERVRKDFVANVSHELRTPLAAIRGYAETLLDGALEDPEHNRQFLEVIQAHAIRLNNIASDLLALSELESQEPGVEPAPLLLRDVLEAAVRTVEPEARVRQVMLAVGHAADLRVLGHVTRLEQVFINLLDNAIKFNHPGGEVRIEATAGPDTASIAITDTGIGIPSQDLPRIFERFYRVDKARSRAVGGTGLGLSIVRHAIERMDGTIRVESQLGKGSRFTVTLPLWKQT